MAKLTDFLGRPHSGLVPHAVVGVVVDNDDPDQLARVKVKFPTLHEEPQSYWLRVSSPNAGKERGFYALPEIDDEVLVMFMQGSQDVGIIMGQFWNGIDLPPKEAIAGMPGSAKTDTGAGWSTAKFTDGSTDDADNDRRIWRSRSGHLFVFDDTSGSETVQIWDGSLKLALAFDTAAGLITLSNNQGDIHIRAKENVFIEAGKDMKFKAGMVWQTESGQDTKMKAGTNFNIEAGTNSEIKAAMNMDVKGGMNLTAKAGMAGSFEGGMTATLKGGVSTTVKGAVVMIN
jgi:phage baseplate assembly protein gpV